MRDERKNIRPEFLVVFIFFLSLNLLGQTILHPSSSTSSSTITCGTSYNYYDSGGLSSNYGSGESGILVLNPSSAGQYVRIVFENFSVEENGTGCYDNLKIYDGNSTSASLLGTYCNSNPPTVLTSTSGSLTLEFYSDSGTEKLGWEATVSCSLTAGTPPVIIQPNTGVLNSTITCGTEYYYYDSGSSKNYGASESSSITLNPSAAGQFVQIDFSLGYFDVEADVSSCYDYIKVYDGTSTAAPVIGTYCNINSPNIITSSTGSLTVEFSSDSGTNLKGWIAMVSCSVTPGSVSLTHPTTGTTNSIIDCGLSYNYYDSGGNIMDYSSNEDGVYVFTPSVVGNYVQIDFNSSNFLIETDVDECYDYITIYDGSSTSSPLIGTYCSLNPPSSSIISSTGALTVVFLSDAFTNESGWEATVSCSAVAGRNPIIQPSSNDEIRVVTCGETYSFYDSGAEGRNYADSENTLLTVCPDVVGQYISVEINDFKMEDTEDYLYVFDGNEASASILALYTGVVPSGTTVKASSNNSTGCLSFRSASDEGTTEMGWDMTITCDNAPSVPVSAGTNDCTGAVSICSDENLIGGTVGFGNQELLAWKSCLGLDGEDGEKQSNWYVFSSTSDGTIGFLLTPDATADYDWAIWGPYNSLECPAFTNDVPIRCSAASYLNSGVNGETGLKAGAGDTYENSSGDGYLEPLTVLADELYVMMLDNWDSNDNPFELSWQLTGASLDCTPLPVVLTSFTATCKSFGVQLMWNTVSERNSNFFVIEKSKDGEHFYEIGKQQGHGNSNRTNTYSFIDKELSTEQVYYRLLQVDFDGSTEYHDIIVVNCKIESEASFKAVQISSNKLLVNLNIPKGVYQLTIYNNLGRLILNKKIQVLEEYEEIIIDKLKLVNGLYLISIQNNLHTYTNKVIMN